jgi:sugar phosphate isomerase/epimerase
MDIGMSLFNLYYERLIQALPIMASSGAKAVEVSYLPFTASDAQLGDLARQYAEAGLPWRSIHAQFGDAGDIGSAIEGLRRHGVEGHKDLIRRASVVGARYIVVHPGRGVHDVSRIPGQEVSTRRSLEELVPLAEEAGVVLALENMLPQHSYEHAERQRALVDEFNSPALRTCFDCGHAHVGEGVPHVVKALGETIVTVHLADNDTSSDLHLQPPYGTINWTHVFQGLEAAGYRDVLTVETQPWGKARPSRLVLELQALYNTAMKIEGALPRLLRDERTGAWLRCRGCNHFWVETAEGITCACDDEPLDYQGV